MKRFRGKYRIESTRLHGHDYASAGWYHVVLCTRDRMCCLGEVRDGIVGLSDAGMIVAEEWQRTHQVRPYVRLDTWIVMPNYIHGILGITTATPAAVETPRRGVSTKRLRHVNTLEPHSLGAIIGQCKSISTKRIRRREYADFAWQPRFYDRIIRNDRELQATRRYILDNPLKWHLDQHHPDRL